MTVTTSDTGALLIRGGCVYPADAADRVIPDGAVLAVGGRIEFVGPAAEADKQVSALAPRVRAGLRTIEAAGKMVLPGFVNDHWHEMFAMRLPFRGALRPADDRADEPGFMALGGDVLQISSIFDSFYDRLGALNDDEAEAIARYSMWTQLRSGVTTLADTGSFNHPAAMIAAARSLGMRLSVSTWAGDAVCAPGESRHRRTRDADGVLTGIEAVLRTAAADPSGLIRARPSAVYITNMSDELGRGFAELVRSYEVPFAVHAGALRNEPDVIRQYYGTTPVRRLAELGLLSAGLTAVHTAYADPEEGELLLSADAQISHSPAKYGGAGEATLSTTRFIPQMRRAGLRVSLSTDATALPIGGMAEAMRAVWQSYNEMYADQTEVRSTDALAMATRIPARGLAWDGLVGSLEEGKQADLVLVPTDDWRYLLNPRPLESFLALGGSADVDTVVVAGRVLIEAGRTVAADEDRLRDDYLAALRTFSLRGLGLAPEAVDAVLPVVTPRAEASQTSMTQAATSQTSKTQTSTTGARS